MSPDTNPRPPYAHMFRCTHTCVLMRTHTHRWKEKNIIWTAFGGAECPLACGMLRQWEFEASLVYLDHAKGKERKEGGERKEGKEKWKRNKHEKEQSTWSAGKSIFSRLVGGGIPEGPRPGGDEHGAL